MPPLKQFTLASIALLTLALGFSACGNKNQPSQEAAKNSLMSEQPQKSPEEIIKEKADDLLGDAALAVRKFEREPSEKNFKRLMKVYDELQTLCDDEDLFRADRKLAAEADSTAQSVKALLETGLKRIRKPLFSESDHLIAETESHPVYLRKGERLFLNFETQGNVTLRVYNADSHSALKTYAGKKVVHDSIPVAHTAVYVVELKPVGSQYVDITASKSVAKAEDLSKDGPNIEEEKTECTAKDFGAQKLQGIKLKSVFEEPRKVTLRSQGKALFSGGGTRSVVAMQVPAGSTDVANCLRISTSQSDQNADGQFCRRMDEKYKEIKLLGLPVYESHGSSSNIFRELLNACEPYREEEAYCNLYIFTSSAEAKKFADGKPVADLKYNVDLSKKGTQSCNDRIPTKGVKTLYFGFENTRVRYSVYLWLESLATMPTTEYYRAKYVVKE